MHLCPQRIVLPRYIMVQLILEKVTVHPALHIVTTDRSECAARPGIMCAPRALGGNVGMSRVHVCVECTQLPLGRRAMMSVVVGRMLVVGADVVRK